MEELLNKLDGRLEELDKEFEDFEKEFQKIDELDVSDIYKTFKLEQLNKKYSKNLSEKMMIKYTKTLLLAMIDEFTELYKILAEVTEND